MANFEWAFNIEGSQGVAAFIGLLQRLDALLTQLTGQAKSTTDAIREMTNGMTDASRVWQQFSRAAGAAQGGRASAPSSSGTSATSAAQPPAIDQGAAQAARDASRLAKEQERAKEQAAREAAKLAREQARAQAEAQAQVTRDAAKAAKEQERAQAEAARNAARAAKEQERAQAQAAREVARAAKEQEREQARAARVTRSTGSDTVTGEATPSAREAAKVAREQAREQAAAARETARAAKEQAREQAREQALAAREAIRSAKEQERAQALAARESAKAAKDQSREQARAQTQAAREAMKAAREQERAQSQAARDAAKTAKEQAREQARAQVEAARAAAKAAKEQERAQTQAAREAAREQDRLRTTVVKVTTETKRHGNAVTTTTKELNAAGETIRKTVTESQKLGNQTVKNTKIFDGQDGVIRAYTNTVDDAEKKSTSWFMSLVKGAGIWNVLNRAVDVGIKRFHQLKDALGFVFKETLRIGGGFEVARNQLGVLTQSDASPEAKKQFEGIVARAKKIGAETSASTADALQAAIAASKAGMRREDIEGALPQIMNVSLGEGLKAERVAEIGSITASQFKNVGAGQDASGKKLESNASNSLKILQAAAATSSTDLTTLSESMKNAAAGAAMLKMPLDEASAVLAVMSQNGETGSRSGTRFMMAMTRIASQSPQAQKALKALGLSFKDANGDTLPFTQILDMLKDKLAGVQGNAQKMTYLKQIFGESFSSMAFLVEQGGDAIKKQLADIRGSMDIGDKMTGAANGMKAALNAMKGSYEGVFESLVDTLSLPITKYYETLANMLNRVSERAQTLGKAFAGVKGSSNPLEAWLAVIEKTDFRGLLSGLSDEFAKEIATLKKIAGGIAGLLKSLFRAAWAEIASSDVIADIASSANAMATTLFSTLFSTANIKKAASFGMEIGKQIIQGLWQTTSGKIALGAMFTTSGLKTASNIASMAGGISNVATNVTQFAQNNPRAAAFAGNAGLVIGAGVIGGMAANYGINKASAWNDRKVDAETTAMLKSKLTERYQMEQTEQDAGRKARLRREILNLENQYKDVTGSYTGRGQGTAEGWRQERAAQQKEQQRVTQNAALLQQGEDEEKQRAITRHRLSKERIIQEGGMTESQAEYIVSQRTPETPEEKAAALREKQIQYQGNQGRPQAGAEAYLQELDERRQQQQARAEQQTAAYNKYRRLEKPAERGFDMTDEKSWQAYEKAQEAKLIKEDEKGTLVEGEAALKAKQARLEMQGQMVEGDQRYKATQDEQAKTTGEAEIAIQKAGAAMETWLLNPINIFLEKIGQIKAKFGEVTDSLQNKRLDLAEKFGLKTKDEADQGRKAVLEKSLERDKKLLEMAQSPEEKQAIQERMAEKMAKLAELSPEDKEKYAKEADAMLGNAEKSAGEAEDLKLKEVEIQKKNAKESIVTYEKMLEQTQTAGGKAAVLEQLTELYKQFGGEGREKAIEAQRQWAEEKTKAAAEQAENLKRAAEGIQVSNKLLELIVKNTGGGAAELPSTPESTEYQQ